MGKGIIRILVGTAALAVWAQPVKITVQKELVREHFGGAGFHAEMFLSTATQDYFDQVLAKRWKELNPSFARVWHRLAREKPWGRDEKEMAALVRQLVFIKQATGTEIYLTTGGLRETEEGADRQAYAKAIVDDLEFLHQAGATNVKTYCSTNELSLKAWASLRNDLPLFKSYHQAIYEEIQKRGVRVKLLATDASPINYWNTLEWAAANMDDITGVYGGHHYANEYKPDNLEFYEWFKGKCTWAVGLAKSKEKDFILGEFGPGQYLQLKYGVRWDTAEFYGTPLEALGGLQLAEAAVAAMNSGVYSMGYWTFTDYPERTGATSINQWGLFKSMTNGAATRAPYYAYGLLTKYFRGPAAVHRVDSASALLRVAAVENETDRTWSIAVVNRDHGSAAVSIALPGDPGKAFRKFVYDTAHVPVTEDGDLQEPSGKVAAKGGRLEDTIPAASLVVYTTAYDEEPPAAVRGLEVTQERDAKRLRWQANTEKDLCYYRVYHNGVRIGSTTVTEFVDAGPTRRRPGEYMVVAVDQWGNASGR